MDELGQLMFDVEEEQRRFDQAHEAQLQKINDLKEELKAVFLASKESAISEKLKITYRKGASKWQTSWLEGYVIDHPELAKYRSEGKPTVAFILRDDE